MSKNFLRQTIAVLMSLGFMLTAQAQADGNESDPPLPSSAIRLSGFGTLGAIHNRGNGAAVVRDLTQPKGADNRGISWIQDSRLGLQVNADLSSNLEAATQVVTRYRSENNFDPEVTWAFIKYTPYDFLEARAGRIGFDAFLFADSRDVGYSYLWVRPPLEYFGTLFIPYEDGADIVLHTPVADGSARLKLYSGLSRQTVPSLLSQHHWAGNITTGPIGSMEDLEGSRITGGHLEYQNNHWLIRLGRARLKHHKDFPPGSFNLRGFIANEGASALTGNPALGIAPNPALGQAALRFVNDASLTNKHLTFDSLALAYEDGPLQAQMAVNRMKGNALLFPNSRSAYATLGYRLDRITPFALISSIRSKSSNRVNELQRLGASATLVNIANFALMSPLTSQTTYSLGMRYEYSDTIALKFQADFTRNKDCSPVALPMTAYAPCTPPLLWPTVPVDWNGRTQTYSATLDFIF